MVKNIFIILTLAAGCFGLAPLSAKAEDTRGAAVQVGAEVLLRDYRHLVEGKRIGLITNHSAMVGDRHTIDLLHEDPSVTIASLYGPEHGLRGLADAGEAVRDSVDELTGAPIYSLYGQVRRPTMEMLADVEVLIFDMQDVGARFYTYPATMGRAMISAAEARIPFLVLDRPNPLGGNQIEGFIREDRFQSGIGMYPTPITHGMTVGELALMIQGEQWHDGLENLDLQIIRMKGWNRSMLWPETRLKWVPPSPNIPDVETALVYPGTCFFEGTTASEGRGTFEPFLQVGAPGVDGRKIAQVLNDRQIKGLSFAPVVFTPKSIPGMSREPKLLGDEIEGVRLSVTNAQQLAPVAAGVHLLDVFYHALPEELRADFFILRGMNIRAGNEQTQQNIVAGGGVDSIIEAWQDDVRIFNSQRQPYLLYK